MQNKDWDIKNPNQDKVEKIMGILNQWNPLISPPEDYEQYYTESCDIFFWLDMCKTEKKLEKIIAQIFNEGFNVNISLDVCSEPAKKIWAIRKELK